MSLWFHRLDKITNEIISEFLPWNFLYLPGGFLEAFWGFLQASLFMILHTKSQGSPKSFHEAPRKLQKNSGQKPRNNFVGIFVQMMKPKGHFEINWPLGIWICGGSPFYKRDLWASKSVGAHSTKSLKISGCNRWCPKDLRVCAPAALVLTHSLYLAVYSIAFA